MCIFQRRKEEMKCNDYNCSCALQLLLALHEIYDSASLGSITDFLPFDTKTETLKLTQNSGNSFSNTHLSLADA